VPRDLDPGLPPTLLQSVLVLTLLVHVTAQLNGVLEDTVCRLFFSNFIKTQQPLRYALRATIRNTTAGSTRTRANDDRKEFNPGCCVFNCYYFERSTFLTAFDLTATQHPYLERQMGPRQSETQYRQLMLVMLLKALASFGYYGISIVLTSWLSIDFGARDVVAGSLSVPSPMEFLFSCLHARAGALGWRKDGVLFDYCSDTCCEPVYFQSDAAKFGDCDFCHPHTRTLLQVWSVGNVNLDLFGCCWIRDRPARYKEELADWRGPKHTFPTHLRAPLLVSCDR
jgi:hypothetical protein